MASSRVGILLHTIEDFLLVCFALGFVCCLSLLFVVVVVVVVVVVTFIVIVFLKINRLFVSDDGGFF